MHNAEQVLFIHPSHNHNFMFENLHKAGCLVKAPYRGQTIPTRFIRAVWFKYNLPFERIWFKKTIIRYKSEVIVVFDPLITSKYLLWLRASFPEARIIFIYTNLVGRASHLTPDNIPEECRCEKWSYDKGDCDKYDLNHSGAFYFAHLRVKKKEPVYDVMYVGRDKGRAKYLFELENQLNKQGLKTYFHIVADRQHKRFLKPYYKRELRYSEICDLLSESRAVLNIVLDNQNAVTIRDMEALFNDIKLVTNSEYIKEHDFYDSNNIFIINRNNIDGVNEFLNQSGRSMNRDVLAEYSMSAWLERILEAK